METVFSLAFDDGVAMTFVFPERLVEHVRSTYPERFPRLLGLANDEVFAVDETPYGLFVVETSDETRVCLLVYSADNELNGVILNTSSDAVAWGRQVYRSYESQAEPVTA